MKIAAVEPIVIEIPLKQPMASHIGSVATRTCVLAKLTADSGEFGIGEIWNSFPDWGVYDKIAALTFGIAPLLLGEDALDPDGAGRRLHDRLRILSHHTGAVGPIHHLIAGIVMALWDLKGRHEKKPICELLGSDCPDRVPVYASGLGGPGLEETVQRHRELGVRAFKLRVGPDGERDRTNLRKLRSLLGDGETIMIDANQSWSLETALQRLPEYKEFGLGWVEEPLLCGRLDDMRVIRETTGVPVAAGENWYGRDAIGEAVRCRSVDIVQPDVSKTGGIGDIAGIVADLRERHGIPYAPHCLNSAVCLAASIQLFAAVPGGVILEMDAHTNPLREQLFTQPFRVEDGHIAVSRMPGLGYELDEHFVDYYRRRTALQLNL